jgi:hypothetical protein
VYPDVFSAGVRIVPRKFIESSLSQENLRGGYNTTKSRNKKHAGGNIREELRERSNQNAKAYQQ